MTTMGPSPLAQLMMMATAFNFPEWVMAARVGARLGATAQTLQPVLVSLEVSAPLTLTDLDTPEPAPQVSLTRLQLDGLRQALLRDSRLLTDDGFLAALQACERCEEAGDARGCPACMSFQLPS